MIMTFVEIDTPGTGSTVDVVHGFEAGVGGTGHAVGFAATSPAQSAGAPPIKTFICFGKMVTGPPWQQVITAELFTMGGMSLSLLERRVVSPELRRAASPGRRGGPPIERTASPVA